MALVLAEGVVEVTADTKGVGRQVAKDLDDSNGEMGKAGERAGGSIFGGIMKSAAVLGGLKLVGDFIGGSISGASDLSETISKSNTIFGDNAKRIETWATTADKSMGLSKAAALDAAAGFGNMFTQIGFSGDEAAGMSEKVVQMSADLGSFNNLETSDVADRMSAAFRGEYDSLQALIPNINAARVESEAMAMTGKTVASELTAQEKAAAVLAIVNKDGAAAMGDFAKTADGAANTQKTLTASLEDQQAKLGTTLMPLWQGFLGFLSDTAIPVLTQIVDWIGKNAEWLGPLAIGIGVATGAMWLFNAAMSANPIGIVIGLIGGLVAAIVWVATQTTFFQDVFKIAGDVIGGVMKGIGDVFNWLGNNVVAPVANFIGGAIRNVGNVIGGVGSVIGGVMSGIGGAFQWVWNTVSGVIGWLIGAFNNVSSAVQNVFGGISGFIRGVFQNIVGFIKGPINTVIGFINQAITGANVVGGAFGVNIARIPMLAKGGNITGGGSVIVGERGPEILNLGPGASVVPLTTNQRAQGAGGKDDTTIIVNEATDPLGSAGRVAAEMRKFKR